MDRDSIFKALANPTRRQILCWLKDVGIHFPGAEYSAGLGASATQINQRSGLSQSTVSSHLSILLQAGLISTYKSGTWIFFRRNEETIQAFLGEIGQQL